MAIAAAGLFGIACGASSAGGRPDAGPHPDAGSTSIPDAGPVPDAGCRAEPDGGGCYLATAEAGCAGRAFSGFQQFDKCEPATSLWSAGAPDGGDMQGCLRACEQTAGARVCWYLDGTGGFAKDCRTCADATDLFDGSFSNDWAGTFSTSACP